ncbi:MAG: hypothetical protein AAGN35_27745 [Bacteroidota bacterium]
MNEFSSLRRQIRDAVRAAVLSSGLLLGSGLLSLVVGVIYFALWYSHAAQSWGIVAIVGLYFLLIFPSLTAAMAYRTLRNRALHSIWHILRPQIEKSLTHLLARVEDEYGKQPQLSYVQPRIAGLLTKIAEWPLGWVRRPFLALLSPVRLVELVIETLPQLLPPQKMAQLIVLRIEEDILQTRFGVSLSWLLYFLVGHGAIMFWLW